ncbi:MAG TPA: mevalonate kinase, partial [Kofleriaceae bacterium]|nr:mevalonate kinase [Kofleriaceae bacterium]
VILLGEHAVVHGHPALAAAIDRRVTVDFERAPAGPISLAIPRWNLTVATGDAHPLAEALAELARRTGAAHLSLRLRAAAEVPPAAGLGSSAAIMVSVTRALAAAAGRRLPGPEIEAIAGAGECFFHDNPSGIDVALAARGGIGLYRRGAGLARVAAAPLPLAIGLSGEPRRTADMVARVAAELERAPERTAAGLEEMGRAAEAAARAWAAGRAGDIGTGMARAQEILAGIGLSTRAIDGMVEAATRAGATGAKLTGGGGGGAVIALAPGREEDVVAAWRALGYEAFTATAGEVHEPGAADEASEESMERKP